MHQHDQDLIMALAEDTLDPDSAAAARAEVASCSECARDLELQIVAVSTLHEAPEANLTEMESARLRRALRQELAPATEVRFEPTRRRRVPFAALATAAAVLIGVVVIGPRLDLIGGDSQDDAAESLAVATTAAPGTTAPPFDAAAPQGGEEFASTTTAAAAGTAAPTAELGGSNLYAYFLESPDLQELRDSADEFRFDENDLRSFALRRSATSTVLDADPGEAAACINVTLSSESNFVAGFQIARGQVDAREVLYIIYLAEDLEESALLVQAADNCEEFARAS